MKIFECEENHDAAGQAGDLLIACDSIAPNVITILSDFNDDHLLDEKGMAMVFHVATRTIRRMVHRFELPPPISIASKNWWKVGTVRQWIISREQAIVLRAKKVADKLADIYS